MECCAASTVPAVRIPRESIYASFMRCRAAALMPVCIFGCMQCSKSCNQALWSERLECMLMCRLCTALI